MSPPGEGERKRPRSPSQGGDERGAGEDGARWAPPTGEAGGPSQPGENGAATTVRVAFRYTAFYVTHISVVPLFLICCAFKL